MASVGSRAVGRVVGPLARSESWGAARVAPGQLSGPRARACHSQAAQERKLAAEPPGAPAQLVAGAVQAAASGAPREASGSPARASRTRWNRGGADPGPPDGRAEASRDDSADSSAGCGGAGAPREVRGHIGPGLVRSWAGARCRGSYPGVASVGLDATSAEVGRG